MPEDAFFSPRLVGEFLRMARHDHALSLRQLAAKSKVSASQLLRIESGEFDVRLSALLRAAAALGIPAGVVLEQGWRPSPGFYGKRLGELGLRGLVKAGADAHGKSEGRSKLHKLIPFFANCCMAVGYLARSSNPPKLVKIIGFPFDELKTVFFNVAEAINLFAFADRLSVLEELQDDPLSLLIRLKIAVPEITELFLQEAARREHPFSGMPNFFELL